jgi:hypothetical protein
LNNYCNRFRRVYPLITILALLSIVQLNPLLEYGSTNAYAKYTNSLDAAASQANTCSGNNNNCFGNTIQTGGEGNTPLISSPTGISEPTAPQGDTGDTIPPVDTIPPFGQELQVSGIVGDLVQVHPGQLRFAQASCAPDEVATGGGLTVRSSTLDPLAPQNLDTGHTPTNTPNQWVVSYLNRGENLVVIQASATCAKLVDAS